MRHLDLKPAKSKIIDGVGVAIEKDASLDYEIDNFKEKGRQWYCSGTPYFSRRTKFS